MLTDRPIHTPLPATDLQRAKRFYADKLGLTPETELPDARDGLFYRCGGNTRFLVFPSAALKARGVIFEEYDMPGLKTINSVATIGQSKGAWFKDSEGNLLALGQFD